MCKGGVAQLSEPIKRQVPQIGNDRLSSCPCKVITLRLDPEVKAMGSLMDLRHGDAEIG